MRLFYGLPCLGTIALALFLGFIGWYPHNAKADVRPPRNVQKKAAKRKAHKKHSKRRASQRKASRRLWMPTPLPKKQRKILFGSPEDTLTKKACTGRRRVTLKCRDKQHYITTNEFHHEMWYPYIKNRGGGYVGVGTDQNFTLMAWARSRIGWMIDYDPVVVRVNLAHRAFILNSPNRRKYRRYWTRRHEKRSVRFLRKFYKKHPDREGIIEAFLYARLKVNFHYHIIKKRRFGWNFHRMKVDPKRKNLRDKRDFNWMHQESTYQYIRKMFQTHRIRVMKGDLLLSTSIRGIGKAAKKMGIPIRLFYTSNAEEFWKYPKSFRLNFLGLPMDKRSLILRTRFTSKYGNRLDAWIYIIQSGLHFQKMLRNPANNRVDTTMRYRKKVIRGLFTIKVPTPRSYMRHLRTP